MSSSVPAGFLDLYSASNKQNTDINIIGVVTDYLPPSRSRGTDWMCTFSIADSTLGGFDNGLKVKFFRPMETELPAIRGTGDVVLIRNIRVRPWSGMTLALSNHISTWVVFPAGLIPEKAPPSDFVQLKHIKESRATAPTTSEMLYVISLCNSRDRNAYPTPMDPLVTSTPVSSHMTLPPTSIRRDKFSLIKDVQIEYFYDLIGQVVKIFPGSGNTDLAITDYTSNNLLYNYEWDQDEVNESISNGDSHGYTSRTSAKKWRGPYGYMTLNVTLWPPHSYFAQVSIKEDDYVHVRNVRIKLNSNGKVEGSLHTDRRQSDRIDITPLTELTDERVKDLLRRKLEYSKRFNSQREAFIKEARAAKRKHDGEGEVLSKNQAKKRRKQEREKREKIELAKPESPVIPKARKQDLNKSIQCTYPSIPTRPLSSILSFATHATQTPTSNIPHVLPFQNICSRATVRVIDFFPTALEDFAVPCPLASEYDVLSENENSASSSDDENSDVEVTNTRERKWEWRFSLFLEDATPGIIDSEKERIKVYVACQDAEFLLKLDAENLRTHPQTLLLLREKLFHLWGDLEERKTSALRSRDINQPSKNAPNNHDPGNTDTLNPLQRARGLAFVCCVKEYGIWVRKRRRGKEEGRESRSGSESESEGGWERRWRIFGTTIT